MARSLNIWVAAALILAIGAPDAQALVRHPRHPVVHPGDIVVHARRSYLDPGPTGGVGTGNRYVTDSGPNSFADFGMPFAANRGFDLLPSRFNPPGRPEPLFQF
jgi:hypothetical protein